MGDATIVMPNDVQVLLESISSSFRVNPTLSFVTTLVIAVSLFGLISYYVRQQRKDREKRLRSSEAHYRTLLRRADLPSGAALLLDRLARYLRDPARRFLLLESEATFNACLRRLEARERVSPSLLAAVRMKLGYCAPNPERIPLCSGDIAEDSVVFVEQLAANKATPRGKKRRLFARVAAVEPGFVALDLDAEEGFRRGDRLRILFSNSAGFYALSSQVLGAKDGLLRIAHSNLITTVQRRRHYRRKLTLRAYVRRTDSEPLYIRTILQDLGGGGARLVNPHGIFEVGDLLEVAVDPGLRRWLHLNAEVVRTGEDGTMSLRFVNLRESTRDLILRALFKRYGDYLREQGQEPTTATKAPG